MSNTPSKHSQMEGAGSISRLWSKRMFFAGMFALVGGLSLAWWISHSNRTPSLREISRSKLVILDGRFHEPGMTNFFTGRMVEAYEKGSMKSRSMVVDGQLHGLSEGWHTNGQLQVREQFSNGVSNGLRTKWHENGNKLSEVFIVEGKLHGIFRRWHDNGNLAEEINLTEGEPHGLSRAYYASGFFKALARLEHGKLMRQQFWNDGEKPRTQTD